MMCRKNSIDDVSNSKENKPKLAVLFPKWICVLIVLISLIEVIFVIAMFLLLYFNKISAETFASSVEGSLLSSGIAIIGIAISVWAGLNIANAIEKRDIDELKNKTDELEKSKKILEDQYKVISQSAKSLEQQIIISKFNDAERKNKQIESEIVTLLNELSKTVNDAATRQLMSIMKNYVPEEKVSVTDLVKLERYFTFVYNKHNSTFRNDIELLDYVDKGIVLAEKLLAITTDLKLKTYLEFRKAEFSFYSGYCLTGERKQKAFITAAEIYLSVANGLNANLPKYKETVEIEEIDYEGCNSDQLEISAYMCNTIGEAYSKTIEGLDRDNQLIKSYGSKAIFYCAYATHWKEKELYYRNLGCAIERNAGKDTRITEKLYSLLFEIYYKALQLNCNTTTFKVITSIMDKYINGLLDIKPVKLPQKREVPLYDDKYVETYNNLSEDIQTQLKEILDELRNLSAKAKTLFPSDVVGYTYSCVYFRDMAMISIGDKIVSGRYIDFAKQELEHMKLLDKAAPLTQILEGDIEDLETYLKILK